MLASKRGSWRGTKEDWLATRKLYVGELTKHEPDTARRAVGNLARFHKGWPDLNAVVQALEKIEAEGIEWAKPRPMGEEARVAYQPLREGPVSEGSKQLARTIAANPAGYTGGMHALGILLMMIARREGQEAAHGFARVLLAINPKIEQSLGSAIDAIGRGECRRRGAMTEDDVRRIVREEIEQH